MKTIDLKEKCVRELDLSESVKVDGGVVSLIIAPSVTAIVAYIKFCMETGGQYVIHHAQ